MKKILILLLVINIVCTCAMQRESAAIANEKAVAHVVKQMFARKEARIRRDVESQIFFQGDDSIAIGISMKFLLLIRKTACRYSNIYLKIIKLTQILNSLQKDVLL